MPDSGLILLESHAVLGAANYLDVVVSAVVAGLTEFPCSALSSGCALSLTRPTADSCWPPGMPRPDHTGQTTQGLQHLWPPGPPLLASPVGGFLSTLISPPMPPYPPGIGGVMGVGMLSEEGGSQDPRPQPRTVHQKLKGLPASERPR